MSDQPKFIQKVRPIYVNDDGEEIPSPLNTIPHLQQQFTGTPGACNHGNSVNHTLTPPAGTDYVLTSFHLYCTWVAAEPLTLYNQSVEVILWDSTASTYALIKHYSTQNIVLWDTGASWQIHINEPILPNGWLIPAGNAFRLELTNYSGQNMSTSVIHYMVTVL